MKNDIEKLKERFRNAKTEKEIAAIDKEMDNLSKKKGFSESMLESIKETNKEVEEILLREKLKEVLPAISVSHLAKVYFYKTPQWFYQRLNGNVVNGKTANFTKDELNTLAGALTDISNKIQQSVTLVV
ncbi:MAG: DUF5053 domain-containing protein [Candidatus Azobacteroides sp.]|nr:DUF5053 domain-containing protein [Candidatus Azobacteroides sp.]